MATPTISTVIPVHNRARQIGAALDSVMAQTLLPIEAIVVDDGSSDDTVAAVRARQGDPIPVRVIGLPTNRGGAHARNIGIDAARGQWIALLDSDDLWAPDKLARQCARLGEDELRDDESVCFTNLTVNRHDGSSPAPWNALPFANGGDVEAFILRDRQAVQTSTLLLPAALAREVRFDERLRRHQDLDLVLRLHRRGVSFRYIPDALVTYSADPGAQRVSRRDHAAPSLAWLDIARDYVTPALLSRFYAREVFALHYAGAPLVALRRLAVAALRRGVTLPAAASIAAREILRPGVNALRRVA